MGSICKVARAVVNIPQLIRIGNKTYSSRRHSSTFNPSSPTMYDCRKSSPNLPADSVIPPFEALQGMPSGVFRCTAGEILGQGADKCCCYKNPEYFSFHDMSFYDFHYLLQRHRRKQPASGRKPI